MKIKVCGVIHEEQVRALDNLGVDMIGRIFYPASPRYMALEKPQTTKAEQIGVFVDADPGYVLQHSERHQFKMVQLHGSESPDDITAIRNKGLRVIKAIPVKDEFPEALVLKYAPHVDFLLFDTSGAAPGGNGVAFDHSLLEKYSADLPYFVSGGIGPEDGASIRKIEPRPYAIDINSRFETAPGVKDIQSIQHFLHDIRS